MEWLADPRVWVAFVLLVVGFIGTWSAYKTQVDQIKLDFTNHAKANALAFHELDQEQRTHALKIATLTASHSSQKDVVESLVAQLRDVVKDLQEVAIAIARRESGKS